MYDFVDRNVAGLDPGARLLVWAMRRWVMAIGAGRCPQAAIGPAFLKWGVQDALPHFHMSLMLLNREGRGEFRFAPLRCQRVAEDEALVLGLFPASRADGGRLRGTLELMVVEDAVGPMHAAVTATAIHLELGGRLPQPPAALRSPKAAKP